MRKINYTLMTAKDIDDPRVRANMLVRAALEEAQVLPLLAQVLDTALQAAIEIDDEMERRKILAKVEKAIQRLGYDPDSYSFLLSPSSNLA